MKRLIQMEKKTKLTNEEIAMTLLSVSTLPNVDDCDNENDGKHL